MGASELTPITSYGTNGETAPEPSILADNLEEAGVEATTPMTGDRALIVADADLTAEVRQMLGLSHYSEGTPRALPSGAADGYTMFTPKSGYHPDG